MKNKTMIQKFFFTLLFIIVIINCGSEGNDSDLEDCYIYDQIIQENNMIQPIAEYQNYFLTENKKIYGLDEQGCKQIEVLQDDDTPANITDFFKKGDDLYFTTEETDNSDPKNPVIIGSYFKQSNCEIEKIIKLPTRPTLSRSQLTDSNFSISNFDYQGTMCTDIQNLYMKSGLERFILVDGFSQFSNGLYFHVKEGRGNIRAPGLYHWPLDKPSVNQVLAMGEIW